jgi:predicted amidohydrolase
MWLKKAIEAGANLIVFPEFFVGPKILDGMICFLRENADNDWLKSSSLLAVLAGTTWTNDHNNVMHILDMRGELVGTYYKYSPFSHSPSDGEDNAAYKDCEYLSTPGKNITLVDIDGVGRILPSICRDIIDGELTERLVKNFDTFLLVTSAYSPSVASFKRHYNNYASCHYVTSVLCNACIAVEKGSSLGICTVPMKKGSEMYYYSKTISKCRNWKKDCPDSCCIMLELNYGVETRAKQSMHPEISCRRSK